MQSTYRQETRPRKAGSRSGHKKKIALGGPERRRLTQLVICLVLFFTTLLGRGRLPQPMVQLREEILTLIHADTDFTAAFSNLGRSIARGEPVLKTMEGLWTDVFGMGGGQLLENTGGVDGQVFLQERELLGSGASQQEAWAVRLGWQEEEPEPQAEPTTEQAEDPPLLEAQPQPVYTGPPLPEHCTMEMLELGLEETTTPVMGVISSDYGYREHPIEGGNQFHNGTDVAANMGTPVLAFADGVVDFIGDSEAYGQYIQLRHAGGVTSFYAHCSKLCAKKGQTVSLGDKIAEVGDTGNTTGPHLHFELKLDGVRLNPAYYIEIS